MSEKEKELITKISTTIPRLDKEKQNYILGVAEGLAMAREADKPKDKRNDKRMNKTKQ